MPFHNKKYQKRDWGFIGYGIKVESLRLELIFFLLLFYVGRNIKYKLLHIRGLTTVGSVGLMIQSSQFDMLMELLSK